MQDHIEIARFRAKLQVYLYKPRTFQLSKETYCRPGYKILSCYRSAFIKIFKTLGKLCEVTKAIRKKKIARTVKF